MLGNLENNFGTGEIRFSGKIHGQRRGQELIK